MVCFTTFVNTAVALSALLVTQGALATPSPTPEPDFTVALSLVSRQIDTPSLSGVDSPACSSQCAPLNATASSCTDPSCFCTQTVVNNLATCLDCGLSADKHPTRLNTRRLSIYSQAHATSKDSKSTPSHLRRRRALEHVRLPQQRRLWLVRRLWLR